MAEKKRWVPKKDFKDVGGKKGALHRDLGVPEDQPIPKAKLRAAEHSRNPTIRRRAIHAETMAGWRKPGQGKTRREVLYDHKRG